MSKVKETEKKEAKKAEKPKENAFGVPMGVPLSHEQVVQMTAKMQEKASK